MSSEQSRVIGLGGLLVLVVLVKMTGGLDWLRTIFTYTPYTWQLNPLAGWNPLSGLIGNGSGTGSSGGGGGGGGGSKSGSSSSTDSGTHQAQSADGTVYTVSSTYGASTPQQQDDENRFAHNVGNVSG